MEAVRKNAAPAVSVIIPVYNAQKYLDQCIRSVLDQTFTDFEIILVDDGSTDGSGEICDRYGSQDSRVRVFHKPNGGVSSARNMGLDHAAGKWITFVDSDDYLSERALDIVDNLKDENLVICSYCRLIDDSQQENFICDNRLIEDPSSLSIFYRTALSSIMRSPWSKIFSRELLFDLRFDTVIHVGEDHLFVMKYLQKVRICRLSQEVFYTYRESSVIFWERYEIKVEDAIYTIRELFAAYDSLGVFSVDFEKWIFLDYRRLCRKSIDRSPDLWYKDSYIRYIYRRIRKYLGMDFRIRYWLLSCRFFIKINSMFN